MTSGNGTNHEVISGRVEARNDRGIRIGDDWHNRSQFHPVDLPDVGAEVRLSVDSKGFIRTLEILDSSEPAASSTRDERISRLAVLKAAAAFGASRDECKSSDVLRIADAWLEWVNRA